MGQIIRDLKLDASAANHEAQFTLESQVANTSIRAQGKVALKDNYYAVAQLDTQGIPLQPLFAAYLPAQAPGINGHTELHATLRGPLKDRQHLEAHLTIPVFQVSYESIQLAASAPIRADYRKRRRHAPARRDQGHRHRPAIAGRCASRRQCAGFAQPRWQRGSAAVADSRA